MDTPVVIGLKKENVKFFDHYDLNKAAVALGIPPPGAQLPPDGRYIGITIALPTKLKIPNEYIRMMKLKGKMTERYDSYENMTPMQQYKFAVKHYVPRVITPFIKRGLIVPELTKKGNIHLHIYAYDDDIINDFDMITLQKTVSATQMVRKITKGRTKAQITLNYIHYLKDPKKWLEYLSKDIVKIEDRLEICGFK